MIIISRTMLLSDNNNCKAIVHALQIRHLTDGIVAIDVHGSYINVSSLFFCQSETGDAACSSF